MSLKKEKKQHILVLLRKLVRIIMQRRDALNQKMNEQISDVTFAASAAAIIAVVMIWLLFIPPCLGVANDGTITKVMQDAGLMYRYEDMENANQYFTRIYQVTRWNIEGNAQLVLIRFAKWVDDIFTKDHLFDIRTLAVMYGVMFLPAVFLIVKTGIERVKDFTEKMVLFIASLIMFGDVAYLTYFNSLYAEPIYYITILYIIGSAMALQRKTKYEPMYYGIMLVNTWILCLTRRHCCLAGIIIGGYCYFQYTLAEKKVKRIRYIAAAMLLMAAFFAGVINMPSDYDETSKLHAMTRGVLLQSSNPEETLKSFGIDGAYSTLADVSLYEEYLLAEISNPLLQNGFLDRYHTNDIVAYYLRHPQALAGMLELAVQSSFEIRRAYCGNYERSAGMPKMAKSISWSAYSTYKIRSAPKTLGFVLFLIAAYYLMVRKRLRVKGMFVREYVNYLLTMITITMIGIIHIILVIIQSGDAQLVQFNFILGLCIDLLIFFVGSEILHRLNIFTSKGEDDVSN